MKNIRREIAITGIDGSGKSTVVDMVLAGGSEEETVLKMTRPLAIYEGGRKRPVMEWYGEAMDALHHRGDAMRIKPVITAVNGLNVIAQSRLIEPYLSRRLDPDVIWWARDMVVDPAVYAGFYIPELGKRSMEDCVRIFRAIAGPPCRLLFHLTVEPDTAVKRIRTRIAEQTEDADREKWQHIHETPEHLGMLAVRYAKALECVERMYGSTVLTIATDNRDKAEVAEIVQDYAQHYLSGDSPTLATRSSFTY